MSQASSCPIQPTMRYQPATFLERGVAVPFTTPLLSGARARPGGRTPLELIVASPGGGRGVYILPWEGISQLCRPTLHDRILNERVQARLAVTPWSIREVSREVAAEGSAGTQAAEAAVAAGLAEERLRTTTNFELLMLLVGQVRMPADASAVDLGERARRAVARIAPHLGTSPEAVATMLEELAGVYGRIGAGRTAGRARIPVAIAELQQMRRGIAAWIAGPPGRINPDADFVLATLDLTIACAGQTLAAAEVLLQDIPGLLEQWQRDRGEIAALAGRPDWLLDGWERIRMLWEVEGHAPEAVLAELAELVPATPREVANWVGAPVEGTAGVLRHRRTVRLLEDWRTGRTTQDVVARNERVCALVLAGNSALDASLPGASGPPVAAPA